MYEGIEDIFRLLDTNRLKEALVQLQAISIKSNQWSIRNQIETTLTAYGYMLQYAREGIDDPSRSEFYKQTLRTAYELTDAINIGLTALKTSSVYYDQIRTYFVRPPRTYTELKMQIEVCAEESATISLLQKDSENRNEEIKNIHQTHEAALTELFNKTWTTTFWSEVENKEALAYLQPSLISDNDIAVMISAVTLSLLRVFDVRKFNFLIEAYAHESILINQRAIVGIVLTVLKHEKRIPLYPEALSRISLLMEEESFCKNIHTIQMQLLITHETTKIDKKMREEIIPEMIKNAKNLNRPPIGFDEAEDSEDRNPDWENWMDKTGMSEKIRQMGELQMEGADIYMSTFAQLKNDPFFYQIQHWFYPFDINHPLLEDRKKGKDYSDFIPLKVIASSDYFCNSDKYSFCLSIFSFPNGMKDMGMHSMDGNLMMDDEQKDKIDELIKKPVSAQSISRQYIQDLYRFFKLWRRHDEEEDIFKWKFDLWENPLLKDALLQEQAIKELADYLLQKNHLNDAYTIFQKRMLATPFDAEVFQKAGYIQQKQKNYGKAIEHYKHADILMPDNVWTNKHLAQCYKLVGNLEEALSYYRKVETVKPNNLNIALQIGQCLVRLGKYADALSYFYKVEYLEKNPDNARRAIGWCSFLSGKYDDAIKYYNLLLEGESAQMQDWLNSGHVYWALKEMPKAIEHYKKAQQFFTNHTDFVEMFSHEKDVLIQRGFTSEDINIMLDLLV